MQDLLNNLIEIKTNGPIALSVGICSSADCTDEHSNLLYEMFEAWPKYSGRKHYPVPHSKGLPPNEAYMQINDLWDRNTEYGRNRWELLDFMIERLQYRLSDQ